MGKLKPTHLLSTTDAIAYLRVARNTLKSHERQGHIQPVGWDGIDPKTKMWAVADLDNLKVNMDPYVGKRGKRLDALATLGGQAVVPQQSIVVQPSLESGLMEVCSVPPNFTLPQGQTVLRHQFMELTRRNKIIQKLEGLLDSPSEKTQLDTIKTILAKIVPDLKSMEHSTVPDENTAIRQERTVQALELIAKSGKSLPMQEIVVLEEIE